VKIASVAEVKARLSAYLNASQEGPVIVTRNGKPVAVLLAVQDDEELERLLLAYSPRLRSILEASREEIREGRAIPMKSSGERWRLRTEDEMGDRIDTPEYYATHREAVAAVAERAGIDLVVLFGSVAQGRLRRESDVDIAVRFIEGKPEFEAEARVADELHEALRPARQLDLVVLNGASPLLLAEVAGDGFVLYAASPETWSRFWIFARRRFEDTEKYRRRHWEALTRRVLG